MADNFEASLKMVLKHEGGFVDHPKDPGGATNKGVTRQTYESFWVDLWRASMSLLKFQMNMFKKSIGYVIGTKLRGMTFLLALIFLFLIGA